MKKIKAEQLGAELRRLAEITEENFDKALQKLSIDGFSMLVHYSAKDTGFLRSNWAVTTGQPLDSVLRNPGGNYSDATYFNPDIKTGDTVTFYNNTEYAMYLEAGTEKMEAQPMIQPTISFLTSEARAVSKALSRKKVE